MYEKEQERWNAVLKGHWWGRGHYAIVKELIGSYVKEQGRSGLRCLDIGCSGGLIMGFLEQFGQVYGFDLSFDGLIYCSDRCRIVQADATRIPFQSDSFDLVTILDVAEHVDDDELLFKEVHRVARKNATIFVNVPAFPFFWRSHDVRYGHKRRYVRCDLKRLAQRNHFTIEKNIYLHAHFALPLFFSVLVDKVFRRSLGERDDFISLGRFPDSLLLGTLLLEQRLLRNLTIPFGISLFCILKKQQ